MKVQIGISLVVALLLSMSGAAAQAPSQFSISGAAADRLHDHISISADTAKRIAEAAEAIAKKNNSAMTVVILNPYGLVVHQHSMDGEGWVDINAAQQKARTALLSRAPSKLLANRNVRDPFTETHMREYDLSVQEGGLPIIVNGQLIGAIGVGGIPGNERNPTYDEDQCARDALIAVLGPQPPLPPNVPPQARPAAAAPRP